MTKESTLFSITKYSDVVLAIAVIGILAVLIIPVPPRILDLLLAFNISLSLVILLATMYITAPLELSVFPGLLLIITLFRLSLNVASTRLILGDAYAGEVIKAFGTFVVKGNYVVGFIIFLILVVIQFVVITKGSGRIAEVAARFTLDAMPGKQMAIDADLNSGLITEEDAKKRRESISKEADFYGAMDGASKFVRGDAIAGVLINLINILGGLVIGVVQMGMPIGQALRTYTLLTVGDGLVTQIPALIISTAAGIIVTRAASDSHMGQDLTRQLVFKPRPVMITAIVLILFGLVPGLPTIPFLILGTLTAMVGFSANQTQKKQNQEKIEKVKEEKKPPEKPEEYLKVDPLEIEIGYGLIPLVDVSQGGDLLDRISIIRRQCALDLGLIVPPVRIRDNVQLKPNEYRLKIKGTTVAQAELSLGNLLAINPSGMADDLSGMETLEPAFGLKAKWISPSLKELAEMKGFTVVEPAAVLATHLTEIIKKHAPEILSRQDVQNLLDNLKKDYPAVTDELIPSLMSVGGIQKILQNLLKERVPIKDLVTILETLADYASVTKDAEVLTEYARFALSRTITQMYLSSDGKMTVFTLDPKLEQLLAESTQSTKFGISVVLPPEVAARIINQVTLLYEQMNSSGQNPIVLTSPQVRLALKRFIEGSLPDLVVLSYNEISPQVEVYSTGIVSVEDAN